VHGADLLVDGGSHAFSRHRDPAAPGSG
jgi:hypothetical protein